MARRLVVIVPIVASAAAMALMIVMLVAGTNPSNGNANYWLALNTSKVGQNVIQFRPANTADPTDPLTSIIGGLDGILGGLISNITGQITQGLQDIEGQILGNLTKALGVKETYNLYLTKVCEGNYANALDPNSAATITSCSTYEDKSAGLRKITSSFPSSLVVGTTNISVPLVSALGSTLTSVTSLATQSAKAMFVLLVISTVSTGLMMVGSVMVLAFGYRRILVVMNNLFGILGANVMFVFAAITTGIIIVGSSTVNGIGSAFNILPKQGGAFLAMSWVAAVLSLIANFFWFLVWFVDFRRTAFRRVWRTEEQIGNYKGIAREVYENVRRPQGVGVRKRKTRAAQKSEEAPSPE